MRRAAVLALALAALAGCTGEDNAETTVTQPTPTTAPERLTTTTEGLLGSCSGEGEFVEGGRIGRIENPASDAGTIGLIGWEAEESCETFEISFETPEGAPATTPPTLTAEYVGDSGVIRLGIDADETVIIDQRVETALVTRLYVVRSLDGAMFVDFHLAAPAQARLSSQSSPAAVTLQLEPGILGYTGEVTASGPIVLIAPREDTNVERTISVQGYARALESNVLVIATQGDEVVAETSIAAADSPTTWGQFQTEVGLVPGRVSLFVGEESAESGRFEGVSIDVTVQ